MIEIGQVRQINDENGFKNMIGKKLLIKNLVLYGSPLGESPLQYATCLLEDGHIEDVAVDTLERVTDLL